MRETFEEYFLNVEKKFVISVTYVHEDVFNSCE